LENRISEIIPFLPFTQGEIEDIVVKILEKWARIADEKHSIKLRWHPSVVSILAKEYNAKYGVRSLKNIVEKKVLNQLAQSTHTGLVKSGQAAELTVRPAASGSHYEIAVVPLPEGSSPANRPSTTVN
jgi:ATP-dependent Clp protease ATP-binding subunit ClpB